MKGIYRITNTLNGKVYIGQAINLSARETRHFYTLEKGTHHNEHLQRSFDKYGKDGFLFEALEKTGNLDERELFWINTYGGLNSNLNYNFKNPITKEWSDYTKKKKKKTITGKNNPNYGNRWSDELREKVSKQRKGVSLEERIGKEKADLAKKRMSKSQKGRKHSEETKEKIRKANSGVNGPSYGKGYRQVGEKNPMYGKPCKNRKPVIQYTKDGILVKEYDFISQVKEDGFSPSNVMYCARGTKNYKSHKGFIWKFKDDIIQG